MADDFRPRRVDLGRVNERFFTFASGVGLDASVVERVDAHPRMKARMGEYYYTYAAISTFNRKYLVRPPHVNVRVDGRELDGVTVIVQNCDPYTYFGRRPIRINDGASLDDGKLGVTVLRRATVKELPTVLWRAFSGHAHTVAKHRQIDGFPGVEGAVVKALEGTPFPVQVDGDFIGEFESVRYGAAPGALRVVS